VHHYFFNDLLTIHIEQIFHFVGVVTMPFTINYLHVGMLDYHQVESHTNQVQLPMAVVVEDLVLTTTMVA